jgi:hypothetical protein
VSKLPASLATLGGGLVLAVALGACGRVYSYPESVPEHSAELCSDGVDNDYDGKADCDDTDCDGFCVEETLEQCNDQRDNDGDGLVDANDPRCWLLAPPEARRCAESSGTEIFETFDSDFWWPSAGTLRGAWPWRAWGVRENAQIIQSAIHQNDGRSDGLVMFAGATVYSDIAGTSLAALVGQVPFSGSFEGFELSFSVALPLGALLRVGLVPVELAPSASPPVSGAENSLLAITLDTESLPPELVVNVAGSPYRAPLSGCLGQSCSPGWGSLRAVVDEQALQVTYTSSDGVLTELPPIALTSASLPPSRLVFWGSTSDQSIGAGIDDVLLRVKPERPCGFLAPQIPGEVCDADGAAGDFGQTVSVVRSASGEYCALVAASSNVPSRGPTLPAPETLTVWGSSDGASWTPYSSLATPFPALPAGAALIGAGIASDAEGVHAAVAYRAEDEVRLAFVDGESCGHWGELEPGLALFDDAEAPSYVIAGGRHDVYFTRPSGAVPRTLWRVARDAVELPDTPLATLPAEVNAPVSVTLAGSSDLVLAYPRAAGESNTSLGLMVAMRDGSFRPVTAGALVEPPTRPDLWEGQGRLGFDDRGVVAASLAWGPDGGFFLYSGVSTTGRVESGRDEPPLAVGTAQLVAAGGAFASTAVTPDRCGDGICGAGEGCASCAVDCSCDEPFLGDAFAADKPWQNENVEGGRRYVTGDPAVLNWAGGTALWSVLPLEPPIHGDFELSFDWLVRWRPPLSCAFYLGLGAPDPDAGSAGVPKAGVFVRLKKDESCVDGFFARPFALPTGASTDDTPEVGSCTGPDVIPTDRWQRVLFRRRGDELSVVTVREDACGSTEQTLLDQASRADLSALFVGHGGDGFEDCMASPEAGNYMPMQGTLRNLELFVPGGEP